ncbi:MAG: hypothetical protein GY835_24545 [bacterium]|nr:hypothetical protein [bacterium]
MGCPAAVVVGNNLVFSVVTHNPVTRAVSDADSLPAYRVYEDETGTPLVTGTMAKLDDAATLGFYSELIACTAANGFEAGKSYTVYVSATVGGTAGATSLNFKGTASDGVNILPLASTVNASGRLDPNGLAAYQYCRLRATISVTDADGEPVDLSALTLALVAWLKDAPETAIITMRTDGDAELTVGGALNNQVTMDGAPAHTATATQYDWRLYDVDNDVSLATGTLDVEAGASVPA